MVGSPLQTVDDLVEDFLFLKELDPEMVGIGPFIAHQDTPFCNERSGTLDDTLFYLALLRLMFPECAASCNDCPWDDSSKRKRNGCFVRCQCCDAESFSCFSQKKIHVV